MARRTYARFLAAVLIMALLAPVILAQGEDFQFIASVLDERGRPVTDLRREEIVFTENGVEADVVRVQPFAMPVQLTIAVDNGPVSADFLAHYRTGLTALVKSLPGDMEVTLITMAPQPLMVVRSTTDRTRLLRGINGFAPQEESPRFTDTLVEFAKRYETDLQKTSRVTSVPVLLMVSTSVSEAISYEVPEVQRAINFLVGRKAMVHVVMLDARRGSTGLSALNEGRQTLIAIPVTRATRGRYEPLSSSSRLATLLPEMGAQIAVLHRRLVSQLLVTAQRRNGARGPLQNPRIGLTRKGMTGTVSFDGLP
jgi:hypothetical protein